MRFSYQLLPEHPLDELLGTLELLDQLGFWACYSADETYHKDMWSLFAAGAARTSRLRLGAEVAGVILKDPTLVAQQAATLDELTGGRAELVFSTGNFALLQQYHVPPERTRRPIRRLREAHEVMSRFLADGRIDFEGEFYAYSGLFTAARPRQSPLPIKLGGMRGPRSFELAGEIADGLHTAAAYSREALEFTADAFRRGAAHAGRDWKTLDLADNMLGAIAEDADAAREAARVVAAFYVSSMPPELLSRNGVEPADVAPAIAAFNAGDVQRALDLTPPTITDALSVAGTPQDWIDMIEGSFRTVRFQPPARDLCRPLPGGELGRSNHRRPAIARRSDSALPPFSDVCVRVTFANPGPAERLSATPRR
jgi:alkanesulfonate monooxygenase SsuD/methylene tetrahydromethanopterin reductase-like flavin-dependent oxidoreductase (luciferase family)